MAGLLRKGELHEMPKVWAQYRTPPDERWDGDLNDDWFRDRDPDDPTRTIDRKPVIDLLCVWDTVGSLGIPGNLLGQIGRRRHEFHDVRLGDKVHRAYQALAIDERRSSFKPAIWDTSFRADPTTVEQRWFVGAHCDVGGGYRDHQLADQSLLWMIEKARHLIRFDEGYLARFSAFEPGKVGGTAHDERTGWWGLMPAYEREIGRDRSEDVHQTAWDRMAWPLDKPDEYEPMPYKPASLIAFRERKRLSPKPFHPAVVALAASAATVAAVAVARGYNARAARRKAA